MEKYLSVNEIDEQKWKEVKSRIFGRLKISLLNDKIFYFSRFYQGVAIYMLKRDNVIFQIMIICEDQLLRDETAELLLEKNNVIMFTFCSFYDGAIPIPAGAPIMYQRSNRHILN